MTGRAVVLAAVLLSGPAAAQLSPGELSRAHARLEGNEHCLECHRQGKGVDPQLCLSCHAVLGERVAAGAGLHAQNEFQDCRSCHIEHNGRAFELVYWGDGGPRSLDHGRTGYTLEGRHAQLGCRDCHRRELNHQGERLTAAGKDLGRTYLGLDTACLSCHADTHRGQFKGAACTSCHTQDAWRPAPGFDHGATPYPLTGRHRAVACGSCHPTATDDAGSFPRYRGVAAGSCTSCHRDPHQSRFGGRCESCHSTASWQARIDEAAFDHDRTPYPLRGRHRAVTCAKCHATAGAWKRPGHERCVTCHADVHAGQFRRRADGGACSSCHDVNGFRPPRFTLEDHQSTRYPLRESHLAVPCSACHAGAAAAPAGGVETRRFTFSSTGCTACHRDPHHGKLDAYLEPGPEDASGCLSCHNLTAWRMVSFDHGRTDYKLVGRHQTVTCEGCHAREADGLMKLSGLPTACTGCHRDPHAGQLVRAAGCEACHSLEGWKPPRFDHDRDSAYQLTGAHRQVPCAGCHPTESAGGRTWVRYRPLPTACADCHREGTPRGGSP